MFAVHMWAFFVESCSSKDPSVSIDGPAILSHNS